MSVHCEVTACGGKARGCIVPAEEASAESMMCESERAMSTTRRDGAPEVGKGLCADC